VAPDTNVASSVNTYDHVAELALRIDAYALEAHTRRISDEFERITTTFHLGGAGEEGVGEDVTYGAGEQLAQQERGADLPLAGDWSFDAFSEHVGSLDLFRAGEPEHPAYRLYRRWALESAALDLALRQAGRSLAEVLGREPRPIGFVVSLRLGQPPSFEPVQRRLAAYPGIRFKLDATPDWDAALLERLAATGAVASIDFKGAYKGTVVDVETDPALYARVAGAFPEAWLEDPDLTVPEADAALAPHRDRITWDAPIHSVADIEALPFPPRTVNVKPSRVGSVRALFQAYDYCDERGIGMYGGGQSELAQGRGQIQYLASLFHPDGPNDIAPSGYDWTDFPAGLPASPLAPDLEPTGFRRRI
jgi:L-alanine-DL-glutamate epimerase-like enolase superfamily enzyme